MGTTDKQRCPQPVAEYIDDLRSRFEVQTVILFGSRARGDNDEFSDWDLFVVGGELPGDWLERTKLIRRGRPSGVDVFAWTETEVRRYIYRTFIQEIAEDGVALYGNMGWMRELADRYRAGRKNISVEPEKN